MRTAFFGVFFALSLGCGRPAPRGGLVEIWALPGADSSWAVSSAAGDINQDGYADLLVGADWLGNGRGGADLYLGSSQGLSHSPAWSFRAPQSGWLAGSWVAVAGDLDGDGFAEIAVSAKRMKGSGGVWLFKGGPRGPSPEPVQVILGDTPNEDFGERVAAIGDTNGNGRRELALAAFGFDSQRGRVDVFEWDSGPKKLVKIWSTQGEAQGDWFGYTVLGPGDLDGDGHDDLLVSSKNCTGACLKAWLDTDPRFAAIEPQGLSAKEEDQRPKAGRVYLYNGKPGGMDPEAAALAEGEQDGELFGFALAAAGDLSGRGGVDVLSSSIGWGNGRGRLTLLSGGPPPRRLEPLWTANGPPPVDRYRWGYTVAAAGDLDKDGFPDIVAGNPMEKELRVYLGRPGGYAPAQAVSAGDLERFGIMVGAVGDSDGDGLLEIFATGVSAPESGKSPLRVLEWRP